MDLLQREGIPLQEIVFRLIASELDALMVAYPPGLAFFQ
jgi:hypothetical protein